MSTPGIGGGIMKEKTFWLLLLLGCLYLLPPLLLGETFFFRDIGYDFVPQKQLFTTIVRHGELPLWDEFRHGGQPYMGDLNNSALYPTNIFYLIFPFFIAFPLTILLHLLCALGSSYLLARTLGFAPAASAVTSALYGFCGYSLSLINLHGRFLAVAIFPLLLWFWHRSFGEPAKRRWFVLAVFTGCAQVLAGAPEVNVLSLLMLLGWALAYPFPKCSSAKKGLRWVLLGACILAVSLVQILPTAEMGLQSMRGEGIAYEIFSQWSLPPVRLPELVIPNFFGYADTLPYNEYYWGGDIGDKGYPYILSIYIGAAACMLTLLGGLHPGQNHTLPRRLRQLLVLVFGLSLSLSLGRFLPGFRLLSRIPLFTIFRFPIKFLIAGIFPVSILSGYAVHLYFSPLSRRAARRERSADSGKLVLGGLIGITAVLTACVGMVVLSPSLARSLQHLLFQKALGELALKSLSTSLLQLVAMCFALSLLFAYRAIKPGAWQQWLLAALILADLLSAGLRVNMYAPQEFFTKTPPLVSMIRQHLGDGRFFRSTHSLPEQIYVESQDVIDAPPDHVLWLYRWKFEVLSKYLASYYQIPTIFHEDYDLLAQRELIRLGQTLDTLPWPQKLPLLSAGNVTLFVDSDRLMLPGVELIGEIPNRGKMPFFLYKNLDTSRRVEFVSEWKLAESDDDALHWMLAPGYDPRRHVVIHRSEIDLPTNETDAVCQNPSTATTISTVKKTALAQELAVSHACDGFLVFAEPFYPGWKIKVDGSPTPVFRANLAFSAVFLKAGIHTIERVYRPNSCLAGLIGSLACCAACGVWCLFRRPHAARRTQHAIR